MRGAGPFQVSGGWVLVAVLLLAVGCSLSYSSNSSSESSASSSGSSESSETRYRNDVRDFTAAYVKSGGRLDDFRDASASWPRNGGSPTGSRIS